LGFFYRIFMSKTIGSEGMGLYQLISPIYMLVWCFTSSGLSTAISKLTAEQNATKGYGNIRRLTFIACFAATLLAVLTSAVVYIYSPYICTRLLCDKRTILSLQILSLCFPLMAVGSCIRGFFYGMQASEVPAECQVLEQCTRLGIVYLFSEYMARDKLEVACAVAVTGMAVGEAVSFLYAAVRMYFKLNTLKGHPDLSVKRASTMLFCLAFPLTLNRVSGALLSNAENLILPARLEVYGLTRFEAVSLYGQLCGMAMPLVMFPSSLLTALATALMPAVSEASAIKSTARLRSAIEKSLLLTAVVGIGTAGLFVCMPGELGKVIYNQSELGELIKLLGFLCPLIYLQVTLSGILNGLGKQVYIFTVSLTSSLFNIGCIWFFVPKFGLNAFFAGWAISLVVTTLISMHIIRRNISIRLYLNNLLLKPVSAITLSCLCLRAFVGKINIPLNLVSLGCCLALAGGMYIALMAMMMLKNE
jgi:stage V sporulation protein B